MNYRTDIDTLRALAVLAVVAFHGFPSIFPSGFIGVDIFFVISGYLITEIILKDLNSNKFSLQEFYFKRSRRIFPALLFVIAIVMMLGCILLLPSELTRLSKEVISSLFFLANINYYLESGYFDIHSQYKVLLNLWSLSVEEQFYLIWPLFLIYNFRKYLKNKTLIIILLLFSLNIASSDNSADFFLTQNRGWQLLVGAILPILKYETSFEFQFLKNKQIYGLILIIFSFLLITGDQKYPSYWGILPTIGTFLIIASESFKYNIIFNKIFCYIGKISYPLYLTHWPFLVFYRYISRGSDELIGILITLLISLLTAVFIYEFIEKPLKDSRSKKLIPAFIIITFVELLFAIFIYVNPSKFSNNDYTQYNNITLYKNKEYTNQCIEKYDYLFNGGFREKKDFCNVNFNTGVLIVGDSHAAKIYHAFVNEGYKNISHIGRGSCAPIGGLTPLDNWLNCQPAIDNILNWSFQSKYSAIILTGVFNRYFNGEYSIKNPELIERNIENFFEVLAKQDKLFIIIMDNPNLPFDPSKCTKRKISLHKDFDCSFERTIFEREFKNYRDIFTKFKNKYPNILIYDPIDIFCGDTHCRAFDDSGLLYEHDNNHLNNHGASLVIQGMLKRIPELENMGK